VARSADRFFAHDTEHHREHRRCGKTRLDDPLSRRISAGVDLGGPYGLRSCISYVSNGRAQANRAFFAGSCPHMFPRTYKSIYGWICKHECLQSLRVLVPPVRSRSSMPTPEVRKSREWATDLPRVVPENSVVTTIEAGMPFLYHHRNVAVVPDGRRSMRTTLFWCAIGQRGRTSIVESSISWDRTRQQSQTRSSSSACAKTATISPTRFTLRPTESLCCGGSRKSKRRLIRTRTEHSIISRRYCW